MCTSGGSPEREISRRTSWNGTVSVVQVCWCGAASWAMDVRPATCSTADLWPARDFGMRSWIIMSDFSAVHMDRSSYLWTITRVLIEPTSLTPSWKVKALSEYRGQRNLLIWTRSRTYGTTLGEQLHDDIHLREISMPWRPHCWTSGTWFPKLWLPTWLTVWNHVVICVYMSGAITFLIKDSCSHSLVSYSCCSELSWTHISAIFRVSCTSFMSYAVFFLVVRDMSVVWCAVTFLQISYIYRSRFLRYPCFTACKDKFGHECNYQWLPFPESNYIWSLFSIKW